MWVIIASLVLLGAIIFISITVLGYASHSSSLTTQIQDLQHTIDHKTQRLEDYRLRAEQLQDSVPKLKQRSERLKQWIAALKKQKMQLGNKAKADGKTAEQRDLAIRRSLSAVQKRRT